ncbi:MtrAB system histidine kinase MtrB [Cellulomonas taurus]|jgi:two-component system, OmpR family, sensor histidine kinase MtrB|uniref:MtrAB system histidine kinase MtrB n=1 Tax=Cellulomonas taurus TaxID=2729175 RepID=UPI00145F9422|nr:MtrAB system histidine kinase MtrB [Cellulomonas taurus]
MTDDQPVSGAAVRTPHRLARTWRLVSVRTARRLRHLTRAWRSSLQLRVLTLTLAGGLVALAVLGGYLSVSVRDGLFTQRVDQVLAESARAAAQAQETIDASTATTAPEVQQLLNDTVRSLRAGGSGEREVSVLRTSGQQQPILVTGASTDSTMVALVSPDLRLATAEGDGQRWQSVGWPTETGVDPAVMVGQTVTVPAAGTYELYLLYSLQAEQEQLSFLQGVLAIGASVLVAILVGMTWFVTRQAVRPVQQAAETAEQIADGDLTRRMAVRGEDEMARLGRSFNAMTDTLQDQILRMEHLSAMQRRFVSDVSHELRTPLTTVRMAGSMIYDSRDDLDPVLRRSAELMQTQLDRFEDLLADLLEISRFDAGAAMLDVEARDVRDVVAAAVDQAVPLAERKGSWLSVVEPGTPCVADIDPRRVERVLRNLLVNAIEHAEGTDVQVTVATDARAVAVTVRDHGVGMTRDEADHVFDRFWRADPARARTTGGTGLGLAISLEDAHLHGGWLEAWGRPGHGAAFRLTLPLRAGITLTGSPLPLQPEDDLIDDTPVDDYRADGSDPAALPDLPAVTGSMEIVERARAAQALRDAQIRAEAAAERAAQQNGADR